MRFGMVGQMSPGMRQVVGFGDWPTREGNFGNEWGLRGVAATFQITEKFLIIVLLRI